MMIQHQMNSGSQLFISNQSHELMNQSQMLLNQSQMSHHLQNQPQTAIQFIQRMPSMANRSKMTRKSYGQWSLPPLPPMNAMKFSNPNPNLNGEAYTGIGKSKVCSIWKGKQSVMHKGKQQNRLKAKRFNLKQRVNPKKRVNRLKAPRNTTSYLIHAKKSGGIASMGCSPCPMTPAVLPTPIFSPSREAVVEMAQEEWGVDGYGSMKGLIRLRSPGAHDETLGNGYGGEEDDCEQGSSGSDVEEHVEVERRLDHDLSRFEMVYPSNGGVGYYHNGLENRVDDQGTHIKQLKEQNVMFKERVCVMEREVDELRRRLMSLERLHQVVEDVNQGVVENESGNGSEGDSSPPVGCNGNNKVGELRCNETLCGDPKEVAVEADIHGDGVDDKPKTEQV